MIIDYVQIVKTIGYVGLTGVVFAESGLLIGFFLPGDSLLFTAGILASQGYLNIWLLVPLLFFAAAIGDSIGYSIGYRLGPKVFSKKDSLVFKQDHIRKTQAFFDKHGGKTIVIARFVPVVRTFAPLMAGVGKMHYRHFLAYNVVGALLWAVGITLMGYFLGTRIPNIEKYIVPIAAVIIFISISPSFYHVLKSPAARVRVKASIRRIFTSQK